MSILKMLFPVCVGAPALRHFPRDHAAALARPKGRHPQAAAREIAGHLPLTAMSEEHGRGELSPR